LQLSNLLDKILFIFQVMLVNWRHLAARCRTT